MKSRFLIRSILRRFLAVRGFAVSGNHVFDLRDFDRISEGQWRPAVLERESLFSGEIVRAARLLAATY